MASVRVTWLGHAAFQLEGAGKVVLIDPFITGNPKSPLRSPADVQRADVVCVSHEHADHGFDDAVEICRRTGAVFVSFFDLAQKAQARGISVIGGNVGGTVPVTDGIRVTFTLAFHVVPVVGFVVHLDGVNVYHAGDTCLFSDMRLIGEKFPLDIALLHIGGYFTMDPADAARAVEFLRPKVAIPMHYGTFPLIEQDPHEFARLVGERARVVILKPGETFEYTP
ncbi:MAG: metal-dependent hydrolase [Candidatus Kapabacteria bacterium]|nr:metal-dependent hydrolase [Candidatus Kapabacteria bacterium]MDW8011391.1 metal-dependent hydrolase [Bacteroidota bacterium]